jgi:hypothetical protein
MEKLAVVCDADKQHWVELWAMLDQRQYRATPFFSSISILRGRV